MSASSVANMIFEDASFLFKTNHLIGGFPFIWKSTENKLIICKKTEYFKLFWTFFAGGLNGNVFLMLGFIYFNGDPGIFFKQVMCIDPAAPAV